MKGVGNGRLSIKSHNSLTSFGNPAIHADRTRGFASSNYFDFAISRGLYLIKHIKSHFQRAL